MSDFRRFCVPFAIACLASPVLAASEAASVAVTPSDAPGSNEIVVCGRAFPQIGEALSGSSGTVGYRDFEDRSIARVGELAETVPGVVATQHSGTGKANQYFLRGFNLDHGTDLAGFVDGAPINLRSHGHGQGYMDLNFLIPEILERIDYRKGPYQADVGDFSAAGTIGFITADTLAHPIVEASAGSFGYGRALAAGSTTVGTANLLAAIEAVRSNGPWQLDEDLRKINAFAKLSRGSGGLGRGDGSSLSLSFYHARWNATDQVPERAIDSGLIDRRGTIDPYLGGRATRAAATFNLTTGDTRAMAYATLSDLRLTSNFTYFLDDPVNGDEFRQRDRRILLGGSVKHVLYGGIGRMPASITIGADVRADLIGKIGLYHSKAGVVTSTVRQDSVDEYSGALFGEVQVWPLPRLRAMLGLRADLYGYDVASDLTANSGRGSAAIATPKFALAWNPVGPIELYADYGEGFHSNDARGATISVDPGSGAPADRVKLLARARSAEIGARIERPRFTASAVLFHLNLASELVFSGDRGSTEPNAASWRRGIELSTFWRPTGWLTLDASAALTHARFHGVAPGEDHIPNAVPQVVSAGIAVDPTERWSLSLRLRHFGSAPLIEDDSARSRPTTQVNLGSHWRVGRARLGIDILNLLGSKDDDITYFYRSRLQGEPAAGIDDYHLHPVEPRQVRLSARYSF